MTHHHKHTHSLTHIDKHTHTLTHIDIHTHTLTQKHTLTHMHKSVNMFSWGIFRAAMVRNFLLRWYGQLVAVAGSLVFDRRLFSLNILAFLCSEKRIFSWYRPFPCYTKDFTYRSGVTLNPHQLTKILKKSTFSFGSQEFTTKISTICRKQRA